MTEEERKHDEEIKRQGLYAGAESPPWRKNLPTAELHVDNDPAAKAQFERAQQEQAEFWLQVEALAQRRQRENDNRVAGDAVDEAIFEKWCELDDLERKIRELKLLKPQSITEVDTQSKMLADLESKRSALLQFFDGSPDAAIAQADQEQPVPNPAPAAQVEPVRDAEVDRLDYSMLATPDELIEAFGRNTGMSKAWFGNLKDKPGLERARRVDGMKGRGGHKPLFCPLAVMLWLTKSSRKVGTRLPESTGWKLLESHFPGVYAAHAAADPR